MFNFIAGVSISSYRQSTLPKKFTADYIAVCCSCYMAIIHLSADDGFSIAAELMVCYFDLLDLS